MIILNAYSVTHAASISCGWRSRKKPTILDGWSRLPIRFIREKPKLRLARYLNSPYVQLRVIRAILLIVYLVLFFVFSIVFSIRLDDWDSAVSSQCYDTRFTSFPNSMHPLADYIYLWLTFVSMVSIFLQAVSCSFIEYVERIVADRSTKQWWRIFIPGPEAFYFLSFSF